MLKNRLQQRTLPLQPNQPLQLLTQPHLRRNRQLQLLNLLRKSQVAGFLRQKAPKLISRAR